MRILVHAANVTKYINLLRAYGLLGWDKKIFKYVYKPEQIKGVPRGTYFLPYGDFYTQKASTDIIDAAVERDFIFVSNHNLDKFMTGIAYLLDHEHSHCNDTEMFCHFLELDHDINDREQMKTCRAHCSLFHAELQYDLVSGYRCDECIENFG